MLNLDWMGENYSEKTAEGHLVEEGQNTWIDSKVIHSMALFYPRERRTNSPWKAEEQLQTEEDEDDTNKHGVQWEENKKPYITRVSMMFYPGAGIRSDENFSVASSQSKIFKQR